MRINTTPNPQVEGPGISSQVKSQNTKTRRDLRGKRKSLHMATVKEPR